MYKITEGHLMSGECYFVQFMLFVGGQQKRNQEMQFDGISETFGLNPVDDVKTRMVFKERCNMNKCVDLKNFQSSLQKCFENGLQ